MPKTRFNIKSDGIAASLALTLSPNNLATLKDCFTNSLSRCHTILNHDFGELVELHQPRTVQKEWAKKSHKDLAIMSIGAVMSSLDYYHSKMLPDNTLRDMNHSSCGSDLAKVNRKHCWERTVDFLEGGAGVILAWMTVRHLLPNNLFPEKLLIKRINRATKYVVDSKSLKVEFAHSSLMAGGRHWFFEKTKRQWEKIKKSLDGGDPCALILINRSENISSHLCVLAYDYKVVEDTRFKISIFDTMEPSRIHEISLDFIESKVGIVSTLQHSGSAVIQGIILIELPTKKPPIKRGRKIASYFLLPQINWWINR